MERLRSGKSWSGQFPFKKNSGEKFVALVTKSPLYEDGELVGIVTVSSDAAMYNISSENKRTCTDPAFRRGLNLKRIQWHAQPQIASVSQIASSVSNLASKVLLRKHGDNTCDDSGDAARCCPCTQDVKLEKVAKVLSKLHFGVTRNIGSGMHGNTQRVSGVDTSVGKERKKELCSQGALGATTTHYWTSDAFCVRYNLSEIKNKLENAQVVVAGKVQGSFLNTYPGKCQKCSDASQLEEQFPISHLNATLMPTPPIQNSRSQGMGNAIQRQLDAQRLSCSAVSFGSSHRSSSSKGEHESNLIADCEILWEDLQLHEEIGQGSYAVVYHGTWNKSDVAVKVHYGSQYSEETLIDYKKEAKGLNYLHHRNPPILQRPEIFKPTC